ncbi:MAG: nickel/cobalt transporter [Dehalococcoidia bacterium]
MRTLGLVLLAVCGALVLAAVVRAPRVEAHPLGNFTVSRYSRVEVQAGGVRVRYVVDMAEIPAFQERAAIDGNRDGRIDGDEADAYAGRRVAALGENLRLTIDGHSVPLRAQEWGISFPAGQGGLDTLRLEAWFAGETPAIREAVRAEYRDDNFGDRLGWREIVVVGGPGLDAVDSTTSSTDMSNELRSYPEDLLQQPLEQRSATFSLASGVGQDIGARSEAGGTAVGRKQDRFAELITREQSLGVLLLSLLVAMGLGAVHALGPGHGKTVVAAYLVGSRGTTKHALFLGLTVTLTHTSSVFALGLVVLYLSDYILPEQLYPWLSFASGASIAVLGLILLAGRTRTLLKRRRPTAIVAQHEVEPMAAHHHGRSPFQTHTHARMRHYAPEAGAAQSHGGSVMHSHGGQAHSHLPPGASGERVTWRSLLALGISGGLLPCPSALVVLLTAISLHRVGYGMLLIVAFSIGLAGVLTGIGLILVHARGLFSRLPMDSTIARMLPVLSAMAVTFIGVGIAVRALEGGSGLSI